jgi:hypothetical protein
MEKYYNIFNKTTFIMLKNKKNTVFNKKIK